MASIEPGSSYLPKFDPNNSKSNGDAVKLAKNINVNEWTNKMECDQQKMNNRHRKHLQHFLRPM